MLSPQAIEAIGTVAGSCTTFAFVPQVVKVYRQGGRDLSYGMLLFFLAGVLLWLAYGILRHAQAVILANAATSALVALSIGLKVWRERKPAPGLVAEQLAERS